MKNTDIKYKTSKDYNELHKLLKEGVILIGFIAISIDNVPNMDHSKLIVMSYDSECEFFDIGFCLFERDFDKESFYKICIKNNIRYLL